MTTGQNLRLRLRTIVGRIALISRRVVPDLSSRKPRASSSSKPSQHHRPCLHPAALDLRVAMRPVKDMSESDAEPESTAVVRARVLRAREAARARWAGTGWSTNAEVPGPVLRRRFRLPRAVTEPIGAALAWTVADLAGRDRPLVEDVSAAMGLRDRRAA